MKISAVLQTLLGGLAGLCLAGSASAGLVTNGTFDSGTSGWTLSGVDGFTWSGSEGNTGGALILNNGPGPVPQAAQTISGLVSGTTYRISLDAKSHYNCCNNGYASPGSGVAIDGHQFDFFIYNGQAWTTKTFDFTYAGGSSLLVLSSQRNGTDADGEFDNVSITAVSSPTSVPLPPSLALLGIGLVAGRMVRRKAC